MIKLKYKVNKSAATRILHIKAQIIYEDTWESEDAIKNFMCGVEEVFKLIRLDDKLKSDN